MTTSNDLEARWQRYAAARSKANAINKTTVFDALAAASITSVFVEFDGEGDSGQIETVMFFQGEASVETPVTTVSIQQASHGETETVATEEALQSAIETLCYDYLEEAHGGWEINEGAFGRFCFDVAKCEIELEFNGRLIDYVQSNHIF